MPSSGKAMEIDFFIGGFIEKVRLCGKKNILETCKFLSNVTKRCFVSLLACSNPVNYKEALTEKNFQNSLGVQRKTN